MKFTALAEELEQTTRQLRSALESVGIKPNRGVIDLLQTATALVSAIELASEPEADLKAEKIMEEITKLRHQNFARWLMIEVEGGRQIHIDDVTPLMDLVARSFRGAADLLARKSIMTGQEVFGVFQGPLANFGNEIDRLFPERHEDDQ